MSHVEADAEQHGDSGAGAPGAPQCAVNNATVEHTFSENGASLELGQDASRAVDAEYEVPTLDFMKFLQPDA